jgi:hypothetical protein
MDKKTEGVEILVKDVLVTFSEPYGEDIILEVFQKIEGDLELHRRYNSLSNDLSDDLTDWIVNNWIGKYVKDQTRMNSLREVPANGKCKLITSYMKLGHE